MDIETLSNTANRLVFEKTGQHLSTLEKAVLQGALEHQSYKALATTTYRSAKTLKDIGAQLWQKLATVLDTPIKKSNVRAELERCIGRATSPCSASHPRRDWADAPEGHAFYGRQAELATLRHWILQDRCRLVAIAGMRGIGKTGLAVKLGMGGVGKTDLSLQLARGIQDEFDCVIWRSLLNAPSVHDILCDLIYFLSNYQLNELPETLDAKILLLLKCLKQQRCLLVLDNVESILLGRQSSQPAAAPSPLLSHAGRYREGHGGYGQLFQKIAEVSHQSCLLITSRESPKNLQTVAATHEKVQFFQLQGLDVKDAKKIFCTHESQPDQEVLTEEIIRFYDGNPLALNIIQKRIQSVFNGNIADFIAQDNLFFEDINELLEWHFLRLGKPEQEILYWLAINREPTLVSELKADCVAFDIQERVADILEALQLRLPINTSSSGFTLQPVIIEYLTVRLIQQLYREIHSESIDLLGRISLQKASAKTYVRETQHRLIVVPLIEQCLAKFGSQVTVVAQLNGLLQVIRQTADLCTGYAPANVLTLLCALEVDLTGYDFSGLSIRQAYLQDVELRRVNFSYADLSTARFNQSFGGIHSLAFCPEGKLLAAGDSKGRIHLLRRRDYQQVGLLMGHVSNLWVASVAFAKSHPWLVSGSFDKTIRLWDLRSGECLKILEGHSHWIWTVAISSDDRFIASGGDDCEVKIWDVNTGMCLHSLSDHDNWVWAVAFSPDGKTLATGSYDRTIRLWEVATGDCLAVLDGHDNSIWALSFSPDGRFLASGSLDYTVRLWNLQNQRCERVFAGHTKEVRAIAFEPDGTTIVSGSFDGTLKRWDITSGQCLATLTGHRVGIRTVAVSPDGQAIASGDHDAQSLRIWNPSSGHCLQALRGYTNWVWAVDIHPQRALIATGGLDGLIRLWCLETGTCVRILRGHDNWIWQVAFSHDGNTLVSCGDDETIRIWNLDSGTCLAILKGHRKGGVWAIAFKPQENSLVSAGQDGTLRFWDLQTTEQLQVIQAHDNWVWSVNFTSQHDLLASCSDDGTIRLWDTLTYQVRGTITASGSKILSLAWVESDFLVVSGHDDGMIRLWDVATQQLVRVFSGHQGWVLSLAFNPDDKTLMSGAQDNTIRVWQLNTGECLRVLTAHQGWVTSIALAGQNNLFVTGSADATVRIWDLGTQQCLRKIQLPLPYDGMNISHATGLTASQKANLQSLGAVLNHA
ncbi:MAG: WD40 repeat domain-containing protein [Cyanobacteria bacterium P01_H01_bin.153]